MENAWKSLLLSGDGKCLHSIGIKGKAILLTLVLLPFPICCLLHPSWVPESGWDHLPETRNLKQGCPQAGLPSPFRSTPFIQQKMAPSFCKHIHTCAKHTIHGHPTWETCCSHSFLSLVYLWRTPKSITRGDQLPFQCHPSSLATAGPTPEKRRSGVGAMVS